MNPQETDDRAAFAKALDWVSRIMTACFAMILPPVAGYFLDQWLGTVVLFVLLGSLFGFVSGGYLLIKAVNRNQT